MAKTDNERYVQRGRDSVLKYDDTWEDDVEEANRHKMGAPYRYAERTIMLAAALTVARHVRYRQLEDKISEMPGEGHECPDYSTAQEDKQA